MAAQPPLSDRPPFSTKRNDVPVGDRFRWTPPPEAPPCHHLPPDRVIFAATRRILTGPQCCRSVPRHHCPIFYSASGGIRRRTPAPLW
jgi:hypothetical protein